MEPRVNYFIVGLFVIGLTAATIVTTFWLSASDHKSYKKYLVYMKESVSGLSVQASVKFNGVEVGSVTDIRLNAKDPQQVELLLSIEKGTPINQSTKAMLMSQGITGIMFIGLKAGAAAAPPLVVQPGQNYPIIAWQPSVLVQVDAAIREITQDIRNISDDFEELMNEENQQAVHQTLINMAKLSSVLADQSQQIGGSLKNLNVILQNSQQVMQGFSQQVMPGMVNALDAFNRILQQLGPLSKTLQENPSVLIRGKAQGALGPGEKGG